MGENSGYCRVGVAVTEEDEDDGGRCGIDRVGLISSDVGLVADRLLFATMSKSVWPSEGKGRLERVGTADADTVRFSRIEGAEKDEMAGGREGEKGVDVCACGCCRLVSCIEGKPNGEGECDNGRCCREESV